MQSKIMDALGNSKLFIPVRFKTYVQLSPAEIVGDVTRVLTTKLRQQLEGVCSRYGFIRPNSIEILKRSAGQFVKQHFNGNVRYELLCKGEVCNPVQGTVLKAVVRNKNAMGLLAESTISVDDKEVPVLDVIVPMRAAGIASEIDVEKANIGDVIYISVQGKRYQLNDKKISIIGRAVRNPADAQNNQVETVDILDNDILPREESLSDVSEVEDEADEAEASEEEFDEEREQPDDEVEDKDAATLLGEDGLMKQILVDPDQDEEDIEMEDEDLEMLDDEYEGGDGYDY